MDWGRGMMAGCALLLSVALCSYPFPLEPLVSVVIPLVSRWYPVGIPLVSRWYPAVDERRHETKPVERSVATELQVWVAYANPNTEWIEAGVGASPADGGGV